MSGPEELPSPAEIVVRLERCEERLTKIAARPVRDPLFKQIGDFLDRDKASNDVGAHVLAFFALLAVTGVAVLVILAIVGVIGRHP